MKSRTIKARGAVNRLFRLRQAGASWLERVRERVNAAADELQNQRRRTRIFSKTQNDHLSQASYKTPGN